MYKLFCTNTKFELSWGTIQYKEWADRILTGCAQQGEPDFTSLHCLIKTVEAASEAFATPARKVDYGCGQRRYSHSGWAVHLGQWLHNQIAAELEDWWQQDQICTLCWWIYPISSGITSAYSAVPKARFRKQEQQFMCTHTLKCSVYKAEFEQLL